MAHEKSHVSGCVLVQVANGVCEGVAVVQRANARDNRGSRCLRTGAQRVAAPCCFEEKSHAEIHVGARNQEVRRAVALKAGKGIEDALSKRPIARNGVVQSAVAFECAAHRERTAVAGQSFQRRVKRGVLLPPLPRAFAAAEPRLIAINPMRRGNAFPIAVRVCAVCSCRGPESGSPILRMAHATHKKPATRAIVALGEPIGFAVLAQRRKERAHPREEDARRRRDARVHIGEVSYRIAERGTRVRRRCVALERADGVRAIHHGEVKCERGSRNDTSRKLKRRESADHGDGGRQPIKEEKSGRTAHPHPRALIEDDWAKRRVGCERRGRTSTPQRNLADETRQGIACCALRLCGDEVRKFRKGSGGHNLGRECGVGWCLHVDTRPAQGCRPRCRSRKRASLRIAQRRSIGCLTIALT